MKINVGCSKRSMSDLTPGKVFFYEDEYYIVTDQTNENGYCCCVVLSDGSAYYFAPYVKVDIANGEFVIKEK